MYKIELNPMPSEADIASLNELERCLSPGSTRTITRTQINRFYRGWNSALVVARASVAFPGAMLGGKIIGMGILTLEDTLTRITAKIDSMVILKEVEGRGVGGTILDALVAHAWTIPQVERVMLTCRASRARGLAMYNKRGFDLHDTNVLYLYRKAA